MGVSYFKLAAALAAMLSGVALLTEYLVPWTSEVQVSFSISYSTVATFT